MSFVAVAVGVGGAAIGAIAQGQAAQNAASTQADAANRATGAQQANYNQTRADLQPYREAGTKALGQLSDQMPDLTRSFSMADFQNDPGYQFNLKQGSDAIQRSAAARGSLNSTGTMKNLAGFASGLASNEYQNAYSRFTNNQKQRYDMLAGVASGGSGAINQVSNVGMNTANNISSNVIGAGNAQAASQIAQGNTMSGLAQGLGNTWMNYSMMNRPVGTTPSSNAYGNDYVSKTADWMANPYSGS